MTWRALALLAILGAPMAARAQGTERYLPSGSQIVLQVDAHAKTKTAYDRTAMGQMMQGETGKFLRSFYRWILDSAETASNEYDTPSREDVALIKNAIKLMEKGVSEGMALGIEVRQAWPVQGRVVVVLPNLAAGESNILTLIRDLREKAKALNAPVEIKDEKVAGRDVSYAELPMVELGWWAEGGDFLFTIGTDPASDYVKAIDAGKTGLANNATYKKLLELGAFPTRSRAYVDVPSFVKLAEAFSPQADKTVEELGLKGMGAVYSIAGYEGAALRGLTEIETIGPRKGLLSGMSDRKIQLADLPPMPSDLTTFSASNANGGQVYGTLLSLVEKIARIYSPDQADNIENGIKGFEGIIGLEFRKDLFDTFDNLTVQYSSPSEGFLGMSGTSLFKVKDEAKLKKSLASLMSAVPQIPGVASSVKKRNYRGVDIYEFHTESPGTFSVQSFAVYKGYFVYAPFPQPVQGYILRADGILPKWNADERLTKALGAFPKDFTGVSFTDPRPAVEGMLAAAPLFITIANGFTGQIPGLAPFDISLIPHAQEATRHLFPNVSVSSDDGARVRMEDRRSFGW